MKRIPFSRLKPSSVRLALSYLAIIMALSVTFSVIFYRTSTSDLNLQLQTSTGGGPESGNNAASPTVGIVGGVDNPTAPVTISGNISGLNTQLHERTVAIRTDLVRRLVMLNIGALLIGAGFSYYLARRTLRPIEAAMDAQARFASDASHELRTPLTVMQAEIEVVLSKSNLSLDRAKAALRSNHQEVTKLRQLSEGLLRLTHTGQSTTFAPVALDEVANDAINQLLKLAQAKHITVIDAVPKLSALGDRQSLVQVLVILLDNAIKYSPSGTAIHIEGDTEGKYTFLRVRDEGPGIRATDLAHIFERFYRADPGRSKQHVSGYGLGLSIAQKIMQQHGGEITVASELDQGSTFTIKLPM